MPRGSMQLITELQKSTAYNRMETHIQIFPVGKMIWVLLDDILPHVAFSRY